MAASIRHSPPSAQDHALRQTVQRMRHQLDKFSSYTWYEHVDPDDTSSRHGHMDLSDIPLPDNVHVFTCGPLGFMRHIRTELMQRGVPAHHIRYEVFGPDLWAAQTGQTLNVESGLNDGLAKPAVTAALAGRHCCRSRC
jgi:nitric oxide dioxygenase